MKQEIDCYRGCAEFDRQYGIYHKMTLYSEQDNMTATARFKIRMVDKQDKNPNNVVRLTLEECIDRYPLTEDEVFKLRDIVKMPRFVGHCFAPVSPRIVDELLCNTFKRK